MQYIISEEDKALIRQKNLDSRVKINILSNDKKILGVLTGVSNFGSFSIDADSNIRRTTNIQIKLDDLFYDIEGKIETYLNVSFEIFFGLKGMRNDEYKYYRMGILYVTSNNTSYDAVTNTLSLDLSDGFAKLDGTINGQVGGSPTITIPVENDGVKNTLKSAMISVIKSETDIKDYIIDDVGEYYGMPQNNEDYENYRSLNPEWNVIPYDLEFSSGDTVASILNEIRDLYPNCQLYFDIYGNLCFDMIPSNENSPITLNNDYIQSILVANDSEIVSYDRSQIKNVVEVFGQSYDVDRFSETSTYSSGIYSITLDSYDAYSAYTIIAFKSVSANDMDSTYIKINNLSNLPLYYEYTTTFVDKNIIGQDDVSAIRIMKNESNQFVAYYLGQYQPHAICVLTDDINDEIYTKTYFAERYNCIEKNVVMIEGKNSPFSVQKLGILFESKSGEEYDNILSDSIAIENAKYLIYQHSVWNDIVTITTKFIPWLDVNTKVEYKKKQEDDVHTYIIKSISHDPSSDTSSITMHRFCSLYQE